MYTLYLPSTGWRTTRSRISRMSSMPRWDAASISTTSSDVPFAIATHAWQTLSGFGVGPCAQLSAFARMRASEVFPVPRGPAKRYACRTWPAAIAFFSVRTTGSCPTTSSKSWGRYFRYSAATAPSLSRRVSDSIGRVRRGFVRFRRGVGLDPSQVEDRRGMRGGGMPVAVGGGGLGVAGLIIYLLISALSGGGGLSGPLANLDNETVAQGAPSPELRSECRTGQDANRRTDCRIVGV